MQFTLALKLGYSHPDEMLNSMSIEQYREWVAFTEIEPVTDRRHEQYLQLICYLLSHGKIKAKDLELFPIHEREQEKPKRQTGQQMKAILVAAATAAKKAKAGRKGKRRR